MIYVTDQKRGNKGLAGSKSEHGQRLSRRAQPAISAAAGGEQIAKACQAAGFFWLSGRVVWLAARVSSPTGDGDRHPRPFIIQPDAGLTTNSDALHVFHITAQNLTDLLAPGMVAGHT